MTPPSPETCLKLATDAQCGRLAEPGAPNRRRVSPSFTHVRPRRSDEGRADNRPEYRTDPRDRLPAPADEHLCEIELTFENLTSVHLVGPR